MADQSSSYEVKITTPADTSGVEAAAQGLGEVKTQGDAAAESLQKVGEATEAIKAPEGLAAQKDAFAEIINSATAAERQTAAYVAALDRASPEALDAIASSLRDMVAQAEAAGQSTDDLNAKIALVTEAQDANTAAAIAAADAENQAAEAAENYKEAAESASEGVGGMSRGLIEGTHLTHLFSAAMTGGHISIRMLIGGMRALISVMLENPLTAALVLVGAAVAYVVEKFMEMREALKTLNEDMKKTEEEGLQRMQERMKAVAEAGKEMAQASFKEAAADVKSMADELQRSLEYTKEIMRENDARNNANMAKDLSDVDLAEKNKTISPDDAVRRRATIRQNYADQKAASDIQDKENEMTRNSGELSKSGDRLGEKQGQVSNERAKLRELEEQQAAAKKQDEENVDWNERHPKSKQQRRENTADDYDVEISHQQSIVTDGSDELKKMQEEHDKLTLKILNENALLEKQIASMKEIHDIAKKTDANKTSGELVDKQREADAKAREEAARKAENDAKLAESQGDFQRAAQLRNQASTTKLAPDATAQQKRQVEIENAARLRQAQQSTTKDISGQAEAWNSGYKDAAGDAITERIKNAAKKVEEHGTSENFTQLGDALQFLGNAVAGKNIEQARQIQVLIKRVDDMAAQLKNNPSRQ